LSGQTRLCRLSWLGRLTGLRGLRRRTEAHSEHEPEAEHDRPTDQTDRTHLAPLAIIDNNNDA
jgi:hypothetical protein